MHQFPLSALDGITASGKAHWCSTLSLSNFPVVALKVVSMFVWMNTTFSQMVECQPLTFSTICPQIFLILWNIRHHLFINCSQKVECQPLLSPSSVQKLFSEGRVSATSFFHHLSTNCSHEVEFQPLLSPTSVHKLFSSGMSATFFLHHLSTNCSQVECQPLSFSTICPQIVLKWNVSHFLSPLSAHKLFSECGMSATYFLHHLPTNCSQNVECQPLSFSTICPQIVLRMWNVSHFLSPPSAHKLFSECGMSATFFLHHLSTN